MGFTGKTDDLIMVKQSVQQCCSDHLIVKLFVPIRGFLVGCDYNGSRLIDLIDKVEKSQGNILLYWEQHDIINNNQIGLNQAFILILLRFYNSL